MRIAVNLLPFRAHLAGAGQYAKNVLAQLQQIDRANEYRLFGNPQGLRIFRLPMIRTIKCSVPPCEVTRERASSGNSTSCLCSCSTTTLICCSRPLWQSPSRGVERKLQSSMWARARVEADCAFAQMW
jgi:hypothetical protein